MLYALEADGLAVLNDEYLYLAMDDGVQIYDITGDALEYLDVVYISESAHRMDISED